tara:strand:+ start:324 stop:506 length:183 start_codon:yes stop_codon:yes gene_type:complete
MPSQILYDELKKKYDKQTVILKEIRDKIKEMSKEQNETIRNEILMILACIDAKNESLINI